MGLSILIPVYNYNVTSLVQALATQLTKTGKEGEIILLDDSSTSFISNNKLLENISFVSFHRNERNEGRMAARLKLSELARYSHLLFIDCDSDLIKDDFVSTYFHLLEQDAALATGGRVYSTAPPADCELMLHWKYGTKRERSKNAGFMSNNFLIRREKFNQLEGLTQLTGYGHEDSWWGIQFEQLGVRCQYINNPVLHAALEKSDIFLSKSENALANLLLLEKSVDKGLLGNHIKIYRWYRRLKNAGLASLYLFFEKPFHNYFRRNIFSCKPSLLFFDCYRLAHLIRLGKKESTV